MTTYWFSPSLKAFFTSDFHNFDNIPRDCVEVNAKDYTYIITQNHRGMNVGVESTTNQPKVSK